MSLGVLASSFTLPKTNVIRLLGYKLSSHRSLCIITCGRRPRDPGVNRGPGGGQINGNTPKSKENDTSRQTYGYETSVKKTDVGLGGVAPKEATTTTTTATS